MSTVVYPFGLMEEQTISAGDTPTISRPTILNVGSAALSAAFTLALSLGAELRKGDLLLIRWLSDSTARTMTPDTGFTGTTAVTGTASKTQVLTCIYNGTSFDKISSLAQ